MAVVLGARHLASRAPVVSAAVVPVRHHTGYIAFEGVLFRPPMSLHVRLSEAVKEINLQPVKRIHFTMDPFVKDVESMRYAMFAFSLEKVRRTNIKCMYKTDIVDDRSDPTIRVEFTDPANKKLVIKTTRLNSFEVLDEFNKIVLPLVQVKDDVVVETKATKTAGSGARGGAKKK